MRLLYSADGAYVGRSRLNCNHATYCKALPLSGPLKCARCSRAFYCGRDCQLADWRARHKTQCGQTQAEVDPYALPQ